MMITGVLSMWISNTGATAMIIPIAVGVLDEMETPDAEQAEETNGETNGYLPSPCSGRF
jgi:di/tricarboxylate transporter